MSSLFENIRAGRELLSFGKEIATAAIDLVHALKGSGDGDEVAQASARLYSAAGRGAWLASHLATGDARLASIVLAALERARHEHPAAFERVRSLWARMAKRGAPIPLDPSAHTDVAAIARILISTVLKDLGLAS